MNNAEEIIKTMTLLVSQNLELSKQNGELTAAINLITLKPELLQDDKIIEELQTIANG